MASSYSTNLAIELIGTGDQAGTWGVTTNTNLGTLIEQAISGYVTQAVSTGGDTTITIPNGSTGVARNMYIELTGTGGTNTNLVVPVNKKLYFIFNNSTGAVTVKVAGQTGVSVPQGKKMILVSNGTDIVNGVNYIADLGTNSFTVTNLTASSGTITNLIATTGTITNLAASDASATVLRSASATITNLIAPTTSATVLRSASATITNLIATTASISDLSATVTRSASATLTNLTSTSGTITTLVSTSATLTTIAGTSANITTITENASPVVVQTDIGTDPNQVPLNQYLGTMAFQDATAITVDQAAIDSLTVSSGSTLNGGVVINELGADADTRIEGDTDANLFFVDASTDRIGVGTNTPGQKLEVAGNIHILTSGNPEIQVKTTGSGNNPKIKLAADTNTFTFDGVFSEATDRLQIDYNSTNLLFLTSSGNLGLGVTPTNNTLGKSLQNGQASAWVSETGSNRFWLGSNWYYDGADKYINNGHATLYSQQSGQHQWLTAASGTAGNTITFTQAMTLDASGNLTVGQSSSTGSLRANGEISFKNTANTSGFDIGLLGGASEPSGFIYQRANSFIAFGTNNTERARITSGGSLLVNTTSDIAKVTLNGVGGSATQTLHGSGWGAGVGAFATLKALDTQNADVIYFETSAAQVGKISITSTATSYGTSSDYRLKEDWKPMENSIDRVMALKPINFAWKSTGDRVDGFLAHEAAEVVPEAVTGEKDEVDGEGNPKYQGIDQSKLVPLLTAALQDALKKIEKLEAKVAALEAK